MRGCCGEPSVWVDVASASRAMRDLMAASGMPELADDPCIVSACRQREADWRVCQEVDLVDGAPWRHVIGLGRDNEDRHMDVGESDRATVDGILAFCKLIFDEEPAQI